jgi:hypothetical protein
VIEITINGLRPEVFELLVVYIYTGSLPFSSKEVMELWIASDFFGLERCKILCALHIKHHISPASVLGILQAADKYECEEVKEFCFQFIAQHYDEVAYSHEVSTLPHTLLVQLARIPTSSFKAEARRPLPDLFKRTTMPISTLKRDLVALINDPTFSDIRFAIDDTVIYAHRFMLLGARAQGTTFPRMLDSGMLESHTRLVTLNDVSPELFISLLEYLYTGSVSINSQEEAIAMLRLADRFLVDALKARCERYVKTCINSSNVLQILAVADTCSLLELKQMCLDVISRNFRVLAHAGALDSFPRDILVEIIQNHAATCTSKHIVS